MDVSKLKRDAEGVKKVLRTLPNGSVATTEPLHIHVPETFRGKSILVMGEEISTMGFIPLILESGIYGVYTIPAMIRLNPGQTNIIEVEGKSYYDFFFPAGTVVFKSVELFKDNSKLYNLVDEVLSRGRVPWYYGYEDMASFFTNVEVYTGTRLVTVRSVGEMVIAQIARLASRRNDPIRYHLTKPGENLRVGLAWLPLRNVTIGAVGLTAKLIGPYMDDGIDAALVEEGGKSSDLEEVLRS